MRINREIHKKLYDESDASFEARKLWYSFKESVFYENRYFVKHKLLDILTQYMNNNILTIETGKV